MKLIVGLGNPGRAYSANRHNVGFHCLDLLARRYGIHFAERRARARIGLGEVSGASLALAKPKTFINLSGEVVFSLLRHFSIPPSHLLVIYDDLDLPLGRLRIRERGSSGGHKGMESIISHLGSEDFPRIRVGIAPQERNMDFDAVEYVLSDFTAEEKPIIKETCAKVSEAIHCILSEGIQVAMSRFN
jgi:PTH1 family peptidyl-tRNA hydrolase